MEDFTSFHRYVNLPVSPTSDVYGFFVETDQSPNIKDIVGSSTPFDILDDLTVHDHLEAGIQTGTPTDSIDNTVFYKNVNDSTHQGENQPFDRHNDPVINFDGVIIQEEEQLGENTTGHSDPSDDPLLGNGWMIEDENVDIGDLLVSLDDPIEQKARRSGEDANNDYESAMPRSGEDTNDYESTMPLSVWPPEPVPFSCSCCQVLRQIVHCSGAGATKLEIHGRVGTIYHGILQTRYNDNGEISVQHQMIDFSVRKPEGVKEYLMQYCQEKREAGFFMLQDPLLAFYNSLCVGIDLDEDFQPLQNETGIQNHPEAESSPVRLPQISLSAQRQRTGNLKLRDLVEYFHLPIHVAAKSLAICPTAIKKICRKNGLQRWPHRKIKAIEKKILTCQTRLRNRNGQRTEDVQRELKDLKEQLNELINM